MTDSLRWVAHRETVVDPAQADRLHYGESSGKDNDDRDALSEVS